MGHFVATCNQTRKETRHNKPSYRHGLPKWREYNLGAPELEALGFAKCYRNTGSDDVVMAHLLKSGRLYIAGNPSLRNPINWTIVGAIAACVTVAAAIAALFIASSKL